MTRGTHGIDAPSSLFGLTIGAVAPLIASAVAFAVGASWAPTSLIIGVALTLLAGLYLHATRRGKFEVWRELLEACP